MNNFPPVIGRHPELIAILTTSGQTIRGTPRWWRCRHGIPAAGIDVFCD
jgi:hypothetical protein